MTMSASSKSVSVIGLCVTLVLVACISGCSDEIESDIEALKDEDPDVRQTAADAPKKIRKAAVPPLIADGDDSPEQWLQQFTDAWQKRDKKRIASLIDLWKPTGPRILKLSNAFLELEEAERAFKKAVGDKFGSDALGKLYKDDTLSLDTDKLIRDPLARLESAEVREIDEPSKASEPAGPEYA